MQFNHYGPVPNNVAEEVKAVAKRIPLERLLVETDCPYLAPAPNRGKRNEPGYVAHTARFLAQLRNEDFAALANATTENFFRLFKKANIQKANAEGHSAPI